jgi:glycosyltransferase involved in cell wall biosynthesis
MASSEYFEIRGKSCSIGSRCCVADQQRAIVIRPELGALTKQIRPRALMIAPAMPAETGNGLAMRLGLFLEALARVTELDLAVLPVAGRGDEPSALLRRVGITPIVIPCDRPDTHFALLSRLEDAQARLEAFRSYGRPRLSAYVSVPVIEKLRAFAARGHYDLIHVGRTYLASAVHPWSGSGAALSLDMDEDDHETIQTIARLQRGNGSPELAAWSQAEALAFDRLIGEVTPRFDRLWISSSIDRRSVQARHPRAEPIVVPNAVANHEMRARRDDGATLIFVASFGYIPNVDAAVWFVREVWPGLRARLPRVKLWLVGRDPPASIVALRHYPGVTVTGSVPDLAPLYARASLALVPLRAGGGTRIKLLEALGQGVPVIATPIGAAGIPVAQTHSGWIAQTPNELALACVAALADAGERRRRGARGRALVRRDYLRSRALARLTDLLAAVLPQ